MASNKKSKTGSILLFVVIILIVGILAIIMESLALSSYENRWKENTIKQRITMIAQTAASSVKELLTAGDEIGITWQLSNLLQSYKGLKYAIVVDKNDRIIGKAGIKIRDQYFRPKEAWLRQTGTTIAFGKIKKGNQTIYQIGIPIMPEGIKARLGSIYVAAGDDLITSEEYAAFAALKKKIYLWSGIALSLIIIIVLIALISVEGGVAYPEDMLDRIVITNSDTFEHVSLVKGMVKKTQFPQSNSAGLEFEHYAKEGMILLPFLKERTKDMVYGFVSASKETTDSFLGAVMLHEAATRAIKEDISLESMLDQIYLYIDYVALRGPKYNLILVQIDKKAGTYKLASVGRNYFADIKDESEAQFTLLDSKPVGVSPNVGDALLPSNVVTMGGEIKSALYIGAYPDETIVERLDKMIEVQTINPVELEKIQDLGGFGVISLIKA